MRKDKKEIHDQEPAVGNDSTEAPRSDRVKTIVAPDPAKVRKADRDREVRRQHESPEGKADIK